MLKYALSLWLTACLLAGISVWSGQAYAQTRKIDKVLQTLKLKKKESSTKPTRKPKGNRGGADVTGASEPVMERRTPKAGRLLPNKNRTNKPTRKPKSKGGGTNVTDADQPRMEKKVPSAGRPIPDKNRVYKPVRRPKRNRDGRNAIVADEPKMEIKIPSVGQPLPKNNKHYQPELNGKKTLSVKQKKGYYPPEIYQGDLKVKKNQVQEPGTHYSKRKAGAGVDAEGPSFSGNQKVKKKDISEPGKGQEKSQRAISRRQQQSGTGFSGFFRKKKRDIRVPGTQHEDRPAGLSRQYANSNEATNYSGSQKVRRNKIQEPGTHYSERKAGAGIDAEGPTFSGNQKVKKKDLSRPGTHYTDRKMSRSASQSNAAANHSGNKRVKKKYLKEPGTLHNERKSALAGQYSSSAATNFQGHLKGTSKRERSRFYEKQSKKVHQYEGDIKLKFNKENMHPSHVARNAKRMRSAEQVARYRSFSKWWTRLWKKEQPEVVKKKPATPRYDKKEKDIWEDSRNW